MDRFFLYIALSLLIIVILLFFPIVLEGDVHFDLDRKKLGFVLYGYKVFKLIGGYVTVYPYGIALHISDKKAILRPFSDMDSERKRFSFIRAFRVLSCSLTTESGAEYFLPLSAIHTALRPVLLSLNSKKGKLHNTLWLTDGDQLKISMNMVTYFNLFILLRAFFKAKLKKGG
jgi:hypothetical protein